MEDHRHYDPDEEHPAWSIIKKILLVLSAVFLILLMITLSLPVNTMSSLLASIQLSPNPPDYIALVGNGTLVIKHGVYNTLLDRYFEEQRKEFKACLLGEKQVDGEGSEQEIIYYVDGIYFPVIKDNGHTFVLAELCNEETLIDLHTHPYLSCFFSDVDLNSLKTVQQINPDAFISLMCGTDRFNFAWY